MWYIDKVWMAKSPNEPFEERPYVFYENPNCRQSAIAVRLKDSVSGELVELKDWVTWDSFVESVKAYSPCGFVYGEKPDGSVMNIALFVRFDELSLQFMELVKSVTYISDCDSDLHKHLLTLRHRSIIWGRDYPVVEWIAGQYTCPLFQILCFVQNGWYEDRFYISTGPQNNSICACIEFTDVVKASRMLLKAICAGYNPVDAYVYRLFR